MTHTIDHAEQPATDVCDLHQDLVIRLTDIVNDLKWLVRIGRWTLTVCGVSMVLIIPLAITFFVHISSINQRLSTMELSVSHTNNELTKHCSMPSHSESARALASIEQRLKSLEGKR